MPSVFDVIDQYTDVFRDEKFKQALEAAFKAARYLPRPYKLPVRRPQK